MAGEACVFLFGEESARVFRGRKVNGRRDVQRFAHSTT